MKKVSKCLFAILLSIIVLNPYIALADPLAGADADLTAYFHVFGGPSNDLTDANDSDDAGDVMWPSGNADTRSAYIGHTSQFTTVVVDVSGVTSQTGENLDMQYWNGESWVALTLDAQTHPFDTTGVNSFSFAIPGDWALSTLSSNEAYYIRTATAGPSSKDGFLDAQISQISVLLAGGEEGAATPEFTDILYIATLVAGAWYVYTKIEKNKNSGLAA